MTEQQERRAAGRERIPFEALVVVNQVGAGASGGGAFECESVNVSAGGIHLRTAYLPAEGQSVSCRFDTGGGEVEARGAVVWRREQAKGGEFGVAFTALDDAGEAALRALTGSEPPAAPAKMATSKAHPGARVRLHIDGLGSPMRARVKDGDTGAVMVGSNLDFLRVGRPLEFEDIDQGKKRSAVIERVGVEVDPVSHVPQLTVSLRYGDAALSGKAVPAPAGGDEVPNDALDDDDIEQRPGAGSRALAALRGRANAALSALSPRVTDAGLKARDALGGVAARLRAGRVVSDARPMRTTTEAPDGGLTANGRRLVREGRDETMDDEKDERDFADNAAKKRPARRLVALAGAGITAAIVAAVALRSGGAPPPSADAQSAAVDAAALAKLTPAAGASAARPLIAGSPEAVTASVPLFGPVALSTTEAAPAPTPSTATTVAQAPGAPALVPGPTPTPVEEADDSPKTPGARRFGRGEVKHPHVVRLKMDAAITEVKGAVSGNSLTLSLPGRRNVEPAATLAKRDKRIAGVKTTPNGDGTDVTFTFKDEVPPFVAKANGRTLQVDLGEAMPGDGEPHARRRAKKGGAHAAHETSGHAGRGHKKKHAN